MATRKRVLVLGAGAAGLAATMALERASAGIPGLEVCLVDQQNYHLFQPLLYQVVTGGVEPGHICFAVRSMLRGGGNTPPVVFRESRVDEIDLARRRVTTDSGAIDWDYLVIALGSTTDFLGVPGAEENALPLKSLRDGITIHNRILDQYEAALREPEGPRLRKLLTFAVVGGGATGVELVASIGDFVSKVMVRDYPKMTALVRVVLVESKDHLLGGMKPEAARLALRRLRARGVEVSLQTRVSQVWQDGLRSKDGLTLSTGLVVWVTGIKPAPVAAVLPFDRAGDGRFIVSPTLEVPETPGVYVVGDCAHLPQPTGEGAYPPTGQIAVRQGLACARNIINAATGREPAPFDYRYKGELISMGRNVAIAQIGQLAFDGFPAWLLWRVYYLGKLMGFRSKLSVAVDWSLAYFYRRNTARLE